MSILKVNISINSVGTHHCNEIGNIIYISMNADPSITSSFMIGYCGRSVTMYRHVKKFLIIKRTYLYLIYSANKLVKTN